MQLKNNFSDETREIFVWTYECWVCGMNRQDAAHHILGRISASPLNFAPVHNTRCHIGNGNLSTFVMQNQLLKKTFDFLQRRKYLLTAEDKKFIKNNIRHYATFLTQSDIKRLIK
jgi:hypothetical protein